MKLITTNEEKIVIEMTREDFIDMHACLKYLVSTESRQDFTAMSLPGPRGKERLKELTLNVMHILKTI